jgi:modulator of FtsH protease HflK
MERILGGSEKLVYDGGNNGQGQGLVPYLPLSELTPRRPAPPAGQQQSGGTR